MNEQEIIRIATDVYNNLGTQFGVAKIPVHIHNGVDTVRISYNDLENKPTTSTSSTYGGKVNANGTAANLPTGWSSSKSGGNVYTITHNLNNAVYAVVAMTENANLPVIFCTPSANSFTLEFDSGGGIATATVFRFILTLIT